MLVSLCAGIGSGASALASFSVTFAPPNAGTSFTVGNPAVYTGTGSGAFTAIQTSGGGTGLNQYQFLASTIGNQLTLSVSFSGTTKLTASPANPSGGNFYAEFPHIQFRLSQVGGASQFWDYGPSINPVAVTSPTVFLAPGANATVALSWSGTHTFTVPTLPGTYRLAWNMSAGNPISEAGKSATVTDTTYAIDGVLVPEVHEMALLTGLGLMAFAGLRRARR